MGWGHPALRSPGWRRPSRLAQNIKFVRRGGIYPARDVRAAAVRADMESAPTRVCNAAGLWFPVWPCAVPPVVGADSISARGPLRRCEVPGLPPRFPRLRRAGVHARRTTAISKSERPRRRGVRRDGGIPPYGRPGGGGHPGWSKAQNLFVGAGFTAPAGAFRRPTAAQRRLLGRRSRPGRSRRREVPGTMQASSPTRVCNAAGLWFPVWTGVCRGS